MKVPFVWCVRHLDLQTGCFYTFPRSKEAPTYLHIDSKISTDDVEAIKDSRKC